jgi:hypothetical protein
MFIRGARYDPRGHWFGEKFWPSIVGPSSDTEKLTPAPLNDTVQFRKSDVGRVRVSRLTRPAASVIVVVESSDDETVTPEMGSE